MKTIQGKFLSAVIAGVLAIALAVGLCAYLMTSRLLHEKADVILSTRCTSEAAAINDTLGDIEKSVQVMAWYCADELESPQALSDPAYADAYAASMQEMYAVIAEHTDGIVAYYLHFNPELAPPDAGFFMCTAAPGDGLTAFPPADMSLYTPDNAADMSWYHQPVSAGHAVWLPPYHSTINDTLIISYVIPMYVEDTLIGVVGMDIDFSMLHRLVSAISVYESSTAHLTDASAQIVHEHPDEHPDTLTMEASSALINGMNLVLCANFSDVIRESLPILAFSGVVFIVLTVVFIWYLIRKTRRITAPLKNLTTAVQKMVEGDISADLTVDTDDEIGVLSRAFRQSAIQLQDRMSTISDLAYRDPLTGVKSRVAYTSAVAELERQIPDHCEPFGLVVFDSNDLKHVNDLYGHEAGNAYIRHICRIICEVFKHSPVYRVGGDEFTVLLRNKDLQNHDALFRSLDGAFAAAPFRTADQKLPTLVARGLAIFDPRTDRAFNDVFDRADKRMYDHKHLMKAEKQ